MDFFKKLKSILKNLFNFFKKFFDHIVQEYYELKYPYKKRYIDLLKTYVEAGFKNTREVYIKTLNSTLRKLGFPIYDESSGMYSEHLILFLQANSNKEIKNILELVL